MGVNLGLAFLAFIPILFTIVVVVSTGMKSYNPLEEDLKSKMPVYVVGDARQVGNAQDAIRDAYETVKDL